MLSFSCSEGLCEPTLLALLIGLPKEPPWSFAVSVIIVMLFLLLTDPRCKAASVWEVETGGGEAVRLCVRLCMANDTWLTERISTK